MTQILATRLTADRASLPDGWWARGLTLAERSKLPGEPEPAVTERAERRLARWKAEHKLSESGQFDRRLAAAGLSEEKLLALLAEDPVGLTVRAGQAPAWAEFTEAVIARLPETVLLPAPPDPEEAWRTGLGVILGPFPELAYEQLVAVARAEGIGQWVDLAKLRAGFIGALVPNLVAIASRTLVLELNVLRVTDRLTGDTPQQRFWSFVRHFAGQAQLVKLLDEYPVLARLLSQAALHAMESWLELLRRFVRDRAHLTERLFGGDDPGPLVEISAGRGDGHQRGRSVALLRFAGGPQLVYKPRPLAAHRHFNQCLDWLNQQVPALGLRTLAVVDRDQYGWVEMATHRPCDDLVGLQWYFRRQGALLALLYALDGADIHFENLIASGDQPVLVDLETLFHPTLPRPGPDLLSADPAVAALDASVSRVGLLPMLVFGEDGSVLDMGGGSGGDAGATMPFKAIGWEDAGTDQMRLVREHLAFPGSQNRPMLGESEVDAGEFLSELFDGFRTAYDAISAGCQELTERILPRFTDAAIRVVPRPTRVYGMLMYESTHPDLLRDALDRDRILDHLWAISREDRLRERLVGFDQADLWAGDVPFFATRTGSRDLWASTGERLPDALAESGLQRAAGKIRQMSSRDRAFQEWIIQASFSARLASTAGGPVPPPADREPGPRDGVEPVEAIDPQRVLDAARAIGDRLADSACRHDGRVGWLGLQFLEESQWLVGQLGFDLYGGYSGVALFLGQLADLTGEQRYADLARSALTPLLPVVDEIVRETPDPRGCGAFGALVGLAYALVHMASNLADQELLAAVEPILTAVTPAVEQDETLDVIGGSAGSLVAALGIHQATGIAAAWDLARVCAQRLLDTAQPQRRGVAWQTSMDASEPLTGFSHGAAGIGWALLRYADATGEHAYAEVGLAAFEYERSRYLPAAGNWPDFRVLPGRPAEQPGSGQHSWCHGSPGIGLARADSRHLAYPQVEEDLDLAVRAMRAAEPDPSHCLCHGHLGNLEALTVAVDRGRSDLAAPRAEWGGRVLANLARFGPVCGTPGGVATPGLMSGLAGIGHGLLRLGFPERVPCVLLLEPPRSGSW